VKRVGTRVLSTRVERRRIRALLRAAMDAAPTDAPTETEADAMFGRTTSRRARASHAVVVTLRSREKIRVRWKR